MTVQITQFAAAAHDMRWQLVQIPFSPPHAVENLEEGESYEVAGQGMIPFILRIATIDNDHTITWPNGLAETILAGQVEYRAATVGTTLVVGSREVRS